MTTTQDTAFETAIPVCLLEQVYAWDWAQEPPLSTFPKLQNIQIQVIDIRIVAETICACQIQTPALPLLLTVTKGAHTLKAQVCMK